MRKQGNIIVTVGISGSGKSTFAAEAVQKNPLEFTTVNRDKIRELLFGYTETTIQDYYKRQDLNKLEKVVTRKEDVLIKEALAEGKTVIVDATHLSREYLTRFHYWNVPVEIKLFEIDLITAIRRDNYRNRKVGEEIIKKQFEKFKSIKASLTQHPIDFTPVTIDNNSDNPPCVIYDIDGTIATMNGRSAYDWKRVGEDLLVPNVTATMDWLNDLQYRPKVIIATGRDGSCLEETKQWLAYNELAYDEIYIRKEGDMRPDWVVKEEIWREIVKTNYIIAMYDDREQVVNRARALGLKVFQVEYH
ncbi:MAG: AAA family ATPase, partial [Methanobacterium sp.]